MSFAIALSVTDEASPVLLGLAGALDDSAGLHAAIAGEGELLTRDYILDEAGKRHKTADRLGAQPTGYLERAAGGVSSYGDTESAVVVLAGDVGGFARAFADVTIKGRGKKLTLPAKAEAYGKRAGEIKDLEVLLWKKADGSFASALGREPDTKDGQRDVWFWLVDKVHQKQDRTLLPSDDQYLAAAEQGAIAYLDATARAASIT